MSKNKTGTREVEEGSSNSGAMIRAQVKNVKEEGMVGRESKSEEESSQTNCRAGTRDPTHDKVMRGKPDRQG